MVALFVQVSLAWSAALPVQCGLCSLTQVSQCLAPGDDLADGGLRTVRPYWAADRRHRHGAIRVAFGRHGAYVPATIQAFLAGGWCAVMALLGKRDRVPAKVRKMWLLEAVAQHRQGGCWVLTDHPFIGGRPSRLDSLEELVEHVKALDGIWVTTLAEIAEHTERLASAPRRHTRSERPAFRTRQRPTGCRSAPRNRSDQELRHRRRKDNDEQQC